MRHAPSGDAVKAEPNLIPLLDLVFQLIMFFMICVNFVSEQVNQDVKLPVAQSARPMDKSEVDVLFLNVDPKGRVITPGADKPLSTVGEIKYYLRLQYDDAKRIAKNQGDKSEQVKTAIIIRGDRDATYQQIFQLLQLCKEVGYRRLQLRAYSKAGG